MREPDGLGVRPLRLTGDNAETARAIAAGVGIREVIADVLPAEKADVVARLQREGASSRWSATARARPADRGAAMALSGVFVVSNSLRLRRFTPSAPR